MSSGIGFDRYQPKLTRYVRHGCLSWAALIVCAAILLGYAAGYERLYQPWQNGPGTHPFTALALALLALGTLIYRPLRGSCIATEGTALPGDWRAPDHRYSGGLAHPRPCGTIYRRVCATIERKPDRIRVEYGGRGSRRQCRRAVADDRASDAVADAGDDSICAPFGFRRRLFLWSPRLLWAMSI